MVPFTNGFWQNGQHLFYKMVLVLFINVWILIVFVFEQSVLVHSFSYSRTIPNRRTGKYFGIQVMAFSSIVEWSVFSDASYSSHDLNYALLLVIKMVVWIAVPFLDARVPCIGHLISRPFNYEKKRPKFQWFHFLEVHYSDHQNNTVGIWNPTIWNLKTFEIQTFWRSDFKWSRPFENRKKWRV